MREHVKIHVEANTDPPAYREAVVYVTLGEPVEGVEIVLRLKESVTVTNCWPRWPDRMGEREALWLATLYPRRLKWGVVYSFGVRLDLQGRLDASLEAVKWEVEDRKVILEAVRKLGLKAVVGPLRPGFGIFDSLGEVEIVRGHGAGYIVIEGGNVAVKLKVAEQGTVSGYLEYEPEASEMPFEVEVRGLTNPTFERTLVLRLPDLHLP